MRACFAALALFMSPIALADAAAEPEPVLKIVNFTADWCPNCQILNPRMDEAIERFEAGAIERVDLDMTNAGRRNGDLERTNAIADAIRTADANQAGYLWDWYGGVTGLAAIVSADNGEPLACINRALSVDQIADRLKIAKVLAERAPAGQRKPNGPDCPAPMN